MAYSEFIELMYNSKALKISLLCILFFSCKNKITPSSPYVDVNKGNFTIIADSTTSYLLNQINEVYQARFPQAKLSCTYSDDKQVLKALIDKKTKIGVIHRELSNNEYNALFDAYQTIPLEKKFAYDAIVLALPKHNDTIFDFNTLKNILNQNNIKVITLKGYDYLYTTLCKKLKVDNPKNTLFYTNNMIEMQQALIANNAIGVLPYSTYSDEDNPEHVITRSLFSFASIQTDSIVAHPSQEDIYLELYPFAIPYNLIACAVLQEEGVGYINYLYKNQIGKLLLKNGLVPDVMPDRYVEIVSQ